MLKVAELLSEGCHAVAVGQDERVCRYYAAIAQLQRLNASSCPSFLVPHYQALHRGFQVTDDTSSFALFKQ